MKSQDNDVELGKRASGTASYGKAEELQNCRAAPAITSAQAVWDQCCVQGLHGKRPWV